MAETNIHIGDEVIITWRDAGFLPKWQPLDDFGDNLDEASLIVTSYGRVLRISDKTLSITGNYAEENTYTPEQANGIMTIPLACIEEVRKITSCEKICCGHESVSEQTPPLS